MEDSLTLGSRPARRLASFVSGAGMVVASVLTIEHFYAANFPDSIWQGSICDLNSFLNCDSSAFSSIAQIGGVPMGFFGLMVGALVCLGAVFPSLPFERTNQSIALLNGMGVVALFVYSVAWLGSLCLLCSVYYLFSLLSLFLFWRFGVDQKGRPLLVRLARPSARHLAAAAVVAAAGAYGFAAYSVAKQEGQSGAVAARVVEQYYSLPEVALPSFVSPFWTARATDRFEDAPIRIIEYADFLCGDCEYLVEQLDRLKIEFEGQLNVAFQFFPLEARCNDVVEKDKHPGACDLSYIAAHDPSRFESIHDEIFANRSAAKDPAWRAELARRNGVEAAIDDPRTRELVERIIRTGAEYEKTHEQFSHGIRSTPTMILNERMIIGTLPYEQLRAIFQTLVDDSADREFLENWVSD